MLAGLRVPAVDEIAGAVFGTGDPGNDDAVGDQRCPGHRIAVPEIDRLLPPNLLAGRSVERDDIGVEGAAKDLAVVERDAAVVEAAADDARGLRRVIDLGFPDLLAGLGVDRHRRGVRR